MRFLQRLQKIKEKKPLYVFYHIPKTGGTTFRINFGEKFKPKERLYWYPDHLVEDNKINKKEYEKIRKVNHSLRSYLKTLTTKEKEEIRFISGHRISIELEEEFKDRKIIYITIIRDPVERVVSRYNHKKWDGTFKKTEEDEVSFKEFRIWLGKGEGERSMTRLFEIFLRKKNITPKIIKTKFKQILLNEDLTRDLRKITKKEVKSKNKTSNLFKSIKKEELRIKTETQREEIRRVLQKDEELYKEIKQEKQNGYPEVIIAGFQHSGTTLIEELLKNINGYEREFQGEFETGFLLVKKPRDFKDKLPDSSMFKKSYMLTDKEEEKIYNTNNFNDMYYMLRKLKGYKFKLIDKKPEYARILREVINKSPKSKYLITIRDPRAVIYSWTKRGNSLNNKNFEVLTNNYITYLKEIEAAYKKYPEKIKIIRYESLCKNPNEEIKKICRFIGYPNQKINYNKLKIRYRLNVKKDHISTEFIEEYKSHMLKPLQDKIINKVKKESKIFFKNIY